MNECKPLIATPLSSEPADIYASTLTLWFTSLRVRAAEWPLDLSGFLRACEEAKASGGGDRLKEVCATIERVFSSADALNSSFVPRAGAGAGAGAGGGEGRGAGSAGGGGGGAGGGGAGEGAATSTTTTDAAPASDGAASLNSTDTSATSATTTTTTTTRHVQDALKLDFAGLRQAYEAVEALGRAVQVDPIKPVLKAPGAMLFKVRYDKPLSNFAFNFNLRRYT